MVRQAGTIQVMDIKSRPKRIKSESLFEGRQHRIFCPLLCESSGEELWKSNGTNEGTVLVKGHKPWSDAFRPSSVVSTW